LHALKETPTAALAAFVVDTPPSGHAIAAQVDAERSAPPLAPGERKLRRLQKAEISPAMSLAAAQIVHKHYAKPVGTEIPVEVDGRQLVARIERHFHPEGGPLKPWGFHPGVSLFIAR